MTEKEHKECARRVYDYLKKKLKDEGAKKIMDKAAKKLGVSGYLNLISGKFPGDGLSKFTVGYLKLITFESYFTLNQTFNYNQYDPKKDADAYVEYLLFSWARGKPGYIYQFDALPKRL